MGTVFFQTAIASITCFIGLFSLLQHEPNPWVVSLNFALMLFFGLSAIIFAIRLN